MEPRNDGHELRDDELRGSPLNERPAPGGTPDQQMADDLLDRAVGESHNPNQQDEIAAHRARFAEVNHELTERLHTAGEAQAAVAAAIKKEAERWQHTPEHQAFIAHQREHSNDPSIDHAGQEYRNTDVIDPGSTVDTPGMPPAQGPTSPLEPDRYRKPSNT